MMNRQTKIVVGASVLVVCVAVAAVIRELCFTPVVEEEESASVVSVTNAVQSATTDVSVRAANSVTNSGATVAREDSAATNAVRLAVRKSVVVETPWTPAEQKTVDALQDALDDDDMKGVVSQLKSAAASTNAAVRLKAVESLQWFGERAVPELTPFMADDDDDVRTTAIDAWTAGVSQMDPGSEKADAVRMGLNVVTDRDQLESMVMQVDDLSDELKIDVLTRIIEGSNEVSAEVAREHYKFWTEEDYANREGAQKWLDKQSSSESDETDI